MKIHSIYSKPLRQVAERQGYYGYDPRHIEAWVRLSFGILDALSRDQLANEVAIACECIKQSNPADSEKLAESFGI